jgi:hypothetical protein
LSRPLHPGPSPHPGHNVTFTEVSGLRWLNGSCVCWINGLAHVHPTGNGKGNCKGDFNNSGLGRWFQPIKNWPCHFKGDHTWCTFFSWHFWKKLPATTMSVMSPVGCFKAAHNQLTRITIPTQEQVKTTTWTIWGFLKWGGTPNHPKLDHFAIKTAWFWGSTILRHPHFHTARAYPTCRQIPLWDSRRVVRIGKCGGHEELEGFLNAPIESCPSRGLWNHLWNKSSAESAQLKEHSC